MTNNKYTTLEERVAAIRKKNRIAQAKWQAKLRQEKIDAGLMKVDANGKYIPRKKSDTTDVNTVQYEYNSRRRDMIKNGTWDTRADNWFQGIPGYSGRVDMIK